MEISQIEVVPSKTPKSKTRHGFGGKAAYHDQKDRSDRPATSTTSRHTFVQLHLSESFDWWSNSLHFHHQSRSSQWTVCEKPGQNAEYLQCINCKIMSHISNVKWSPFKYAYIGLKFLPYVVSILSRYKELHRLSNNECKTQSKHIQTITSVGSAVSHGARLDAPLLVVLLQCLQLHFTRTGIASRLWQLQQGWWYHIMHDLEVHNVQKIRVHSSKYRPTD